MAQLKPGNESLKDQSINISVYKPKGLTSFWSWFSRKNKNNLSDILENGENFDLKLTMEDLTALKISGIDVQRLQNCKLKQTKVTPNDNLFPKDCLGTHNKVLLNSIVIPNLVKNQKMYQKRIISTSTISIKSKTNFGNRNMKYIHNVTSQKSIMNSVGGNRKTRLQDINNKPTAPLNRSVLSESVPAAILKSNTQKKERRKVVPLRRKNENMNKWHNGKLPVSLDIQNRSHDANVIPILLSKIKSMEEQLCDIGNTTKKIKEVVSHNSIIKTTSLPKDLNQSHKNSQSLTKGMPSHKIYSKNVVACKKSKPLTKNKLKKKSKLTVPTIFNDYLQGQINQDQMGVQTLYGAGSYVNHFESKANCTKQDINNANPNLKTNISSTFNNLINEEMARINEKGDYDFIINLLKDLPGAKAIKIQPSTSNSINRNNLVNENTLVHTTNNLSKPTFDWKHKSLSSASETHINKEKECNAKDKKNHSLTGAIDMVEKNINTLSNEKHNLRNKNKPEYDMFEKGLTMDKPKIDELLKESNEIVLNKNAFFNTETKVKPIIHNLLKISEEELFRKPNYSLELYRDIINKLEENENHITATNTTNYEIQSNSISKSQNIQTFTDQSQTTSDKFDNGQHKDENSTDTLIQTTSQLYDDVNNNDLLNSKVSSDKKMITRYTQSDLNASDGVKVSVETSSGDTVKIENLSCGKGLTVMTSSKVSLVKATKVLLEDKVRTTCDEAKNVSNDLPKNVSNDLPKTVSNDLPKTVNISSEALNQEDMFLMSQHQRSIDKEYVEKQGHIYKGIDKFVPPKRIESDKYHFRCPGGYMSQEKRRTYDEYLKRGSKTGQFSQDALYRPHGTAKLNETTSFEDHFKKSINSYLLNHSATSISVVDTQCENQNNKLSTNYNDKSGVLLENKEFEYAGENLSKIISEPPVRNMKKTNISQVNQWKDSASSKQSFFTVIDEKDNLGSKTLVNTRTNLESKRRCFRYGLTIQEPIVEELDKSSLLKLENKTGNNQSEEGDNIKINSLDKSLCTNLLKIDNCDSAKPNNQCKDFTAQLQNIETAFKYLTDLAFSKSTVSVQTDWSLIGITVDHFKHGQSPDKCKTSVSSQTEITMEQLSSSPVLENAIIPTFFSSSTINKNNNDKENLFVGHDSLLPMTEDNQKENDEKISNMVIAMTAQEERNGLENISERITCLNVEASKQTEQNYIDDFELFEFKSTEPHMHFKKPLKNKTSKEQNHCCSIPCFPSISEETIFSDKSESSNEQIMSTEINSTISEVHNKRIISCYNINKEFISINNSPNITQMFDVENGSSLKSNLHFQIPTNPEKNQTRLRSKNNIKLPPFLPLLGDSTEHKSNIGLVSSSNTTIKIVTTSEEICTPGKGAQAEYQYNTFQNNVFTRISTESN